MKIWSVLGVVLLVACTEAERSPLPSGGRDGGPCKDEDGDGFGQNCEIGGDCNDDDPEIHVGCKGCVRPSEGCACDNSHQPVSCYLEPSEAGDGTQMCHEGTRYCRQGAWSACESIFSYPKPAATQSQAVLSSDSGLENCSDCRPNCFVVRDNLNPIDGGLGGNGNNTQVSPEGGLTLGTLPVDAAMVDSGPGYDAATCVLGAAPDEDCDGILDQYDPYPSKKPFETTNPTIFLDLGPGETGASLIDLAFNLNSVDVYFLIDQTTTMDGERDNLVNSLTSGDFVQDPNFDCADYDYDHQPNNELKTKGIIGAIRCYIRDANFGVGFFRELPLGGYADTDDIAYRNLQDITNDVTKVSSAVAKLQPRANNDFDEVAMPALHSVVTGDGMYFGTDRISVPQRTGCPENTWGYPCFRDDAIPIVILFTDAASHNGPGPTLLRAYDSSKMGINYANSAQRVTWTSGNETFASATFAGDVTNSLVSFAGDTSGMVANVAAKGFGSSTCSSETSPDAFYRFTLSSAKTVTFSTQGSEFDTVLGLWAGTAKSVTALPAYPNTNDVATSAYDFGDVANKYAQASGNTSGASMNSDYLAADLGCSSYAGSKDATFKFEVKSPTTVALDTAGSAIGTSLSLFRDAPTPPAYTTITNTNDTYASAYDAGVIDGELKAFAGSTNAGGITNNLTAAQLGCSPADNSPDAVYQFSVGGSTTRRVRISAEDSTLDTVLALTDNGSTVPPTAKGSYENNDSTSSNPALIGELDGKAFQITGKTNVKAITNNYNDIGCSSDSSSRDAVFRFDLKSPATVHMNTNSTSTNFDTVLSLYRTSITASGTSVTGSTSYDDEASSYLINPINARKYTVSGNTSSSMSATYSANQTGSCGAASNSPDAVYKLRFTGPTRVRLDTIGSEFDTLISLHSALPDKVTRTTISTGDTIASPYTVSGNVSDKNLLFENTGTGTTNFAADVSLNNKAGCAADDYAPDAVIAFTVGTTGSYELNTDGSSFDTVLGIYSTTPPAIPTATAMASAGDTSGTAAPSVMPTIDGNWKVYTGDFSTLADNINYPTSWGVPRCNAHNSGRDVFYKFHVDSSREVRIDTVGSTYDGSLALYDSALSYITCNDSSSGDTITRTLGSGDYYAIIKGKESAGGGPYRISIKDTSFGTTPAFCDDDSGAGSQSKIVATLNAGTTYYAVVKGKARTDKGAYKLAIKHLTWMNAFTPMACNDNADASTTSSKLEYDIPAAGDYYVVLKGKSSSGYGNYKLNILDVTSPPDGFVTCNNDSVGTTSAITETLSAGQYWIVLKGRGSTTSGSYVLNLYDTSATPLSVLACDYNSGPGGTSAIEQDLTPGTYRVVVKGKASGEKNNYKLQLRDVSTLPLGSGRIACDYNSSTGNKSYIQTSLSAGTYTVVLKGDSATNGDYKLSIRDAANVASHTEGASSTSCNDNSYTGVTFSSLTSASLAAGTYYVGVRGKTSTAKGNYQLHLGAASAATGKSHTPKTYAETLAAVNARDVHVIPILSCHNDTSKYGSSVQADCPNARTQFQQLATATNTVDDDLTPLVFDIDGDGTGLDKTVVSSVQSLAQYLEMDVRVRVVFAPDANPGFGLSIKALDTPGDGCSAPVDNEHQNCMPGATPRFEVAFTNPLDNPVKLNDLAKDPKGGYNFRAELLANGSFIVDQIPIYIIPEQVVDVPPPPQVHSSGTYWQTLSGNGCENMTDLPDWSELSWNASVPDGTSVSFAACTSDTPDAAASCTPTAICTITGGAACSASMPCASGSFCSIDGNCQRITGGACSSNADCFGSATCQASVCVYNSQPIDVGEILGSQNFQSNLRVQIGLTANTATNKGPTVHDWSLNYSCKSSL